MKRRPCDTGSNSQLDKIVELGECQTFINMKIKHWNERGCSKNCDGTTFQLGIYWHF